jgi:hypothetical protein
VYFVVNKEQTMTINRWHWLMATEIVLAVSAAGEVSAQRQGIMQPQMLPPPQVVTKPAPAPACVEPCTTSPSILHNFKLRVERWCGYERIDAVPLGQSLYSAMSTQIENGIAARMILNDYDYELGGTKLNYRGEDKLRHLAELAMRYPYPIIVERTLYEPGLAKARVEATRKELAALGIPLPPNRIIDAADPVRGLYGIEAQYMYQNLLNQVQSQGGGSGGGGGTNININNSSSSSSGAGAAQSGTTNGSR